MSKRFNDPAFEYLIRAFLTLQTPEECLHFLEDLCTESELAEMSRRLRAAKMLKKSYIYSEIAEQTGLSTATISRVNRSLNYGNDGYDMVFERMNWEE